MSRLIIAGGPRTGKTTRANVMAGQRNLIAQHSDDLIESMEWSEASEEVARWMDEPGPWIIEGVAAVRALRKWLKAHPEGAPCEHVIWMSRPLVRLSPGQATMLKGCETVWRNLTVDLFHRNVEIEIV